MTGLWLVYVRSCRSRRVRSQNRGSGSSLETIGLRQWRVRSWRRGASGHHLTVGAWQLTVGDQRAMLKVGATWTAKSDRTQGLARPVIPKNTQ